VQGGEGEERERKAEEAREGKRVEETPVCILNLPWNSLWVVKC